METLKLEPKNLDGIIKKAVKLIKQGKVVVLPTDTVYGLAADATNKRAVERLFKIKKREKEKSIPIFVKDIKMAKKFAIIGKEQERFLTPRITVVLKKRKSKIKVYGTDSKTIGLRTPNYRLVNILLEKINRPLTGTSANISGNPASTKIREIVSQFENQKPSTRAKHGAGLVPYRNKVSGTGQQPDLIINAGNLPKSRPSKVIDLTDKKPKILRK